MSGNLKYFRRFFVIAKGNLQDSVTAGGTIRLDSLFGYLSELDRLREDSFRGI